MRFYRYKWYNGSSSTSQDFIHDDEYTNEEFNALCIAILAKLDYEASTKYKKECEAYEYHKNHFGSFLQPEPSVPKKLDNDDISKFVCNKLIDRGFKKLQPDVTVFGHDVMLSPEFKLACKRVLRRKKLERILK